jgi:hypothetical protein
MLWTPAADFLHLQLSEILTREPYYTRGNFLRLYCFDQLKLQFLREITHRKHFIITFHGLGSFICSLF